MSAQVRCRTIAQQPCAELGFEPGHTLGHRLLADREHLRGPADSLAELPEDVSAVTAAALPLAGLTALRMLRMAGNVTGRRILLTGASGGVGHYFTELAANAGAEVTAITATAQRGSRLAELGAAVVLRSVTDAGGPYDLVLESAGGDSFARSLERLAPHGTLIWFGQASREPVTVNFFDLVYGNRKRHCRPARAPHPRERRADTQRAVPGIPADRQRRRQAPRGRLKAVNRTAGQFPTVNRAGICPTAPARRWVDLKV
jgi:NADPH:quinone reductase-like Zn-dependent oxidoreductase